MSKSKLSTAGLHLNMFKQCGVGMVEMLVALFILAIGLLGVLAMQATGIQSTQRATFSTEAHMLATDMVDRILASNDIDDPDDDDDYDDIDTVNAQASHDCIEAGCAKGEAQKLFDQLDWSRSISRLPNGRGIVDFETDGAGTGIYTVIVMWDDARTGATELGCGGGENDLTCYSLEVKM